MDRALHDEAISERRGQEPHQQPPQQQRLYLDASREETCIFVERTRRRLSRRFSFSLNVLEYHLEVLPRARTRRSPSARKRRPPSAAPRHVNAPPAPPACPPKIPARTPCPGLPIAPPGPAPPGHVTRVNYKARTSGKQRGVQESTRATQLGWGYSSTDMQVQLGGITAEKPLVLIVPS